MMRVNVWNNTNGRLDSTYLDGGILNFDISMNGNTLANASKEMILQTYLHETLHAVLLAEGSGWEGVLQHEAIANYYRGMMENQIKLSDPSLSSPDACALSFAGLQGITPYKSLPSLKRTEIEQTIGEHKDPHNTGVGHGC